MMAIIMLLIFTFYRSEKDGNYHDFDFYILQVPENRNFILNESFSELGKKKGF